MNVDLIKLRELKMKESEERSPIPESQRFLSVDITFDDSYSSHYSSPLYYDPIDFSSSNKAHLGV